MPASPLVMIGHSMGALMLESGLRALLEGAHQPLIRQTQTTSAGAVRLKSGQGLVFFPDLILALNSAADSGIARSILEAGAAQSGEDTPPATSFSDHHVRDFDRRHGYQGHMAVGAGTSPWRGRMATTALLTHDFR
jgi:hypothetical protein